MSPRFLAWETFIEMGKTVKRGGLMVEEKAVCGCGGFKPYSIL